MKLTKDKVIKDIPENLVSQYEAMGWTEYKEPKTFIAKSKPTNNSEEDK